MNSWVGLEEGQKQNDWRETVTSGESPGFRQDMGRCWVIEGTVVLITIIIIKVLYEVPNSWGSELGLHRELHSSGTSLLDHAWSDTSYWWWHIYYGFITSVWLKSHIICHHLFSIGDFLVILGVKSTKQIYLVSSMILFSSLGQRTSPYIPVCRHAIQDTYRCSVRTD